VPKTIGRVPITIGRVPGKIGQVPACSIESLRTCPSLWVFGRVLGWPANSFPGGNSRQREAVSVFNPRDFEVPLP
jgi:hypothetical protein